MRIISEFAMPEESPSVVSAEAVARWLNEVLPGHEGATLRIFHGDATTYLRLEAAD